MKLQLVLLLLLQICFNVWHAVAPFGPLHLFHYSPVAASEKKAVFVTGWLMVCVLFLYLSTPQHTSPEITHDACGWVCLRETTYTHRNTQTRQRWSTCVKVILHLHWSVCVSACYAFPVWCFLGNGTYASHPAARGSCACVFSWERVLKLQPAKM